MIPKKRMNRIPALLLQHLLLPVLLLLLPVSSNMAADGLKKTHMENEARKVVAVEHVEGVMGHRVEMPCDISPRRRDDTVYMVLWFRETAGKPLYSFDVRGRGMKTAKTWSSKLGFDRRADFQPASHPAYLLVNDLKLTDQGVYRCRVDFRNSPTRNSLVNLTVVVPPSLPVIYDGSGTEILSSVGPYIEGSDVLLTCRVSGGKPEPVVLWYVNGELEDSSYHMDRFGDVINDFLFRGLNRSHLNSQFSCRASNTKLIPAVERTILLELNLKPLYVRMRHKQTDRTVAGQEYRLVCEAAGSKPPATLRWFKGGNEITQVSTQELDDGNVTMSTYVFIPNPGDNGASIICRAENPWLNRSHILEDIWNLNVVYAPEVKLSLGSTLNPMEIKEGTDVYFECKIRANPKASKLVWLFNGEELKHNAAAGIIMSNQSLVLQGIDRKASGNYTCIASNAEGSTHSNALFLSVMYAPVCVIEGPVTVGTSKGETVALRCAVHAAPTAFHFDWEFHGTGDSADVKPDGKAISQGDLSRYFYTPNGDPEFGTFLCWASNDIGRQVQPCVFHVVAAVKPHMLENCTVINQTTTMIHVECNSNRELPSIPDQPLFRIMNEDADKVVQDPTHYGLFPEYYVMEVWDLKNRSVRRNLSAETPNFMLKGLLPGSWLRLILYAVNSHGKSEPVVIETVVAGDAEKQILGASRSQMEFFPLVVLGIGTACVGTLIVFILALILRSRFCASSSSASASDRRRLPVAPSSNSHSIVDKSTALLPSTPTSVTNNSTTLVSPYRNNPVSNNTMNNKHHTETDPANPDIIPGANTYSTDTNNDWTLPRRNNHNSPACIPHENHMDPLGGTIITTDYKSSHYIAYSPMHNQHEQFHPHNLPLFPASNNYQHANKNDYNTIYIRDKLMHDSDIPESCV